MTGTQKQAIWELCRQGLQEAAARAERAWDERAPFEPDTRLPMTREIALLIDQTNRDADTKVRSERTAPAPGLSGSPLSAAA